MPIGEIKTENATKMYNGKTTQHAGIISSNEVTLLGTNAASIAAYVHVESNDGARLPTSFERKRARILLSTSEIQ